jgi:hypothetical protein
MDKKLVSTFCSFTLIGAAVCATSVARASWWQRIPPQTCLYQVGSSTQNGNSTVFIASGTNVDVYSLHNDSVATSRAACPFISESMTQNGVTTSMTDNQAHSIFMDLVNPTGSTLASGNLTAKACVITGWAGSCGAAASSPTIAMQWHATISLDTTAWNADSNVGYAYVFASNTMANTSITIAGIFVST